MEKITPTQNVDASTEPWKGRIACFLSGQAVSLFGSSLTQFAIVWYITLETSSGIMITLSTLCSFLPQILISLFAGVWADRHNRKHIIIIADGMIAIATLILAIIFMSGFREMWLLFLVSAIRSVGSGLQTPAVSAVIPQLVPSGKLMRMNGINGTIQSLTMLVSPAVSGAVLSLFGLETAFFIDVFTAAIAISILCFIKIPRLPREKKPNNELSSPSAFTDLKLGLSYVWNHRFLRAFLFSYAALMFLITPAAILTPLMTTRSFGPEVWRLTANEMVWSFGAAIGGITIAVWGGLKDHIKNLILGIFLFGAFTMAIGFSTNFTVYLVFLFITGLCMPMINSSGMVILQESVESSMQGRIFGLLGIISSSAIPLGMVIFGPLGDLMRIEWLMVGTGVAMALLGVCLFKSRIIRGGYEKSD